MICEKTLKKLCKDDVTKIENYEQAMADTETWDCHHRLELHPDNSVRFTSKSLKKLDLYYNRHASELIFLTHSEHMSMHNKGKTLSAETRQKVSETHKGEKSNWYGKHHSESSRKKISEATMGENHPFYGRHHSAETKQKMSEAKKGKSLSAEHRQKISEAAKRRFSKRRSSPVLNAE